MKDATDQTPSRRLSAEMIAAISAVVVGVCALGVSLYQATIMRQQQKTMFEQSQLMREEQRVSVWPNVAIENSYTGDAFRLRLVNTGIGPAKIGPVRVTLDDKPIFTWTELIHDVYPTGRINYLYSVVANRVMPADDFEVIFALSDDAISDLVQASLSRVAIELCYCSVYDECWRYATRFDGDAIRDPVDGCEVTEDDFRE